MSTSRMSGSTFPTSSWWATAWTTPSATATCRISARSTPRCTSRSNCLAPKLTLGRESARRIRQNVDLGARCVNYLPRNGANGGPRRKMRDMTQTALRICPLCEATCGLTLTIEDGRVTGARGDRDDVFSKGFVCPKGAAFGAVDSDPDRLRTPLVRVDGELREATWAEAFDAVAAGI